MKIFKFFFFSLVKTPKIHIQFLTSRSDIRVGGIVQLHCHVEGIKFTKSNIYLSRILDFLPNKLSWSFQSGLLPNNTHIKNDGHLMIYNFDRFNLGTYTCLAETSTQHLTQSIDFQPNDIFNNIESLLSYQIYSSRSEYHIGGRLLIECISLGKIFFYFFYKI